MNKAKKRLGVLLTLVMLLSLLPMAAQAGLRDDERLESFTFTT